MTQPVILVLTQPQLARLARILTAQKERVLSKAHVGREYVVKHFDDLLNAVSLAKEANPEAIVSTSLLWQTIARDSAGRELLATA